MRKAILYYAITYDGDWKKIKRAIIEHEPWYEVIYKGKYVTYMDENYPKCFRELEFAPWILFYEGNLALCNLSTCGVIGSRQVNEEGIKNCIHICNILKEKYVIVSGLAKGVDAIAHQCALNAHTIAVIGCGIDVVYPKENKHLYEEIAKHHLILSEYPSSSRPYAFHFPWRNRLIAALSDHLVVVQARKRSGTLLTVNEALALNRNVYCVPHRFLDEDGMGCNQLIDSGAYMLVDDEDIYMI